MRRCSSILAVDLGERFTAATVLWREGVVKVSRQGDKGHKQRLRLAP